MATGAGKGERESATPNRAGRGPKDGPDLTGSAFRPGRPTAMLTPSQAEEIASELFELRSKDRPRLDKIRDYLLNKQKLVWLPLGAPRELQALAQMARVPILPLIVKATTQQMFVDGIAATDEDDAEVLNWIWQRNRFDRKQIGIHKAVAEYGVAYGTSMPSDNRVPVLRPSSPRKMTAAFGDDPDWPRYALEQRDDEVWRLYDSTHTYDLKRGQRRTRSVRGGARRTVTFDFIPGTAAPHEQAVTPVVRYVSDEDLDDPVRGDIEPLFPLADKLNLSSFHLLVAQHYGAHGRRAIISRLIGDLEKKLVKNSANTMLTLNAHPDDVNMEEFQQTKLDGFLDSIEATIRTMATLGQTPVSELTGVVANLAAEALIESRESSVRKLSERQTVVGESHEQLLGQAGQLLGVPLDPMARVRWKPNLDQRALAFVDTLAVLADKLGVPEVELWKQAPFPQATIEEWIAARDESRTQEAQTDAGSEPEGAEDEEEPPELTASAE